MRTRVWCISLLLAVLGVACGDQPTEVVPEREMTRAPGVVAAATDSSEDGLSITTDKDDYAPGDTVWLTGAGWPAHDTLDILLEDDPATHAPHAWWVPVREDGTFRDSTYVVDVGDLGVTFTLTATSRSTGRWLDVEFTDGTIVDATIAMRDAPACATAQGSVALGSPICAHAAFAITGGGETRAQLRWKSPAGPIVEVAQRTPPFPAGATSGSFDDTFTPGVAGTWTVLLCQSNDVNLAPAGLPQCPVGSQKASQTFEVTAAGPTKLGFTTAALSGTVGQCLGPITVQAQNASNAPANVTANTTVNLATDGSGGFFTDAACATSTTNRTINTGNNSASFYYEATATGDGTHQLTASASGLTSASQVQTINDKANQTITFPAVGPFSFGDPPFTVSATASSGLTVSFATQTPAKCTIAGTTVTIIEAGTCTIRASQAGNGAFNPAPVVDRDITISRANQTITFPAVGPFTFGDPPFTVSATATSGLAVSFASGTPAKCTVAGNTVTIHAAGTCTIRATQAGNVNYNAAPEVERNITIEKASTTTTVVSSDLSTVYGQAVTFTATVSSAASGISGSVTFKAGAVVLGTGTVGCAATCTAQLTTGPEDLNAATHSITAVYGESANFLGSTSAAISQVVGRAATTTAITSSALTATYGDAGIALSASVTANAPSLAVVSQGSVVFTVKEGTTVVGTVSDAVSGGAAGATFPLLGVDAGSYTVEAAYQPAASAPNFLASSDATPEPLTVERAATVTLITSIGGSPFILNGTVTVNFSVAPKYAGNYASQPSGTVEVKKGGLASLCSTTLPDSDCGFTASVIGDYSLTANYGGDDNYLPSGSAASLITVKYQFSGFFAPVDRPNTMNVSKAAQAIPLKWRLTDANGNGAPDLTAVTVKAVSISCVGYGTTTDQIEEYAAGSSGLQNLGDGYYQYNWKTPSTYANSCKNIALSFGAGGSSYTEEPSALFTFKK